jgi:predicted DNA-binding transcriptional regulator AlpA
MVSAMQTRHRNILAALVTERLVREPERQSITGVSRAHWARLVAVGRAPRPIRVSDRIAAWRLTDLQQWVELIARGEQWSPEAAPSDALP